MVLRELFTAAGGDDQPDETYCSLETQLEDLRKENDDHYTRIMTSVDLDYIRDVSPLTQLGMVYAGPGQVVLYDNGTDDYVRQDGDIPSDHSSLKDKVLGKDGE